MCCCCSFRKAAIFRFAQATLLQLPYSCHLSLRTGAAAANAAIVRFAQLGVVLHFDAKTKCMFANVCSDGAWEL
jgi:hypothetical protein